MITADRLRELLDYDPETGIFAWKMTNSRRRVAGSIAGGLADGYINIGLDKRRYRAHVLAWIWMTGSDPGLLDIDHIDENKSNNRWANLRLATRSQNKQNIQRPQSNNKSGFRGVWWSGHRWKACIRLNGKVTHLGSFQSPEEAHDAYISAKAKLHPFARPT